MVGLGFARNLLKVDQFRQIRMSKDVMAPSGAPEGKTKAADQSDHIRKSDIPKIALSKFLG